MNKIRENSCVFVAKNLRVRGSALIMAIVSTTLLFIIGSLFLLSSRTYKQTTASADAYATEDAAVNAVIDRINTVLTQDLFGVTEPVNMLNSSTGVPDADEYWDYPYSAYPVAGNNDDYWLASLEPEFEGFGTAATNDDIYYWRHITDLWNNNFGVPLIDFFGIPVKYYDPDDSTVVAQWDWTSYAAPYYTPYWYWVFNADDPGINLNYYKPTVAQIVSDERNISVVLDNSVAVTSLTPRYWPWGARADADGDGVADSRWVKIPDVTAPDGKNVYTAVRIIDNCGMININSAYRNPDDAANLTTAKGPWDGSQLSHINLRDIRAKGDFDNSITEKNFQFARMGTVHGFPDDTTIWDYNDYANDQRYEISVSRRLLNPASEIDTSSNYYEYNPFDIQEEIVLRNRFFLNSIANARCGYVNGIGNPILWQVTFEPDGFPGRSYPMGHYGTDTPALWFNILKPDIEEATYVANPIVDYNRRHIATTYSFDRVIIPKKFSGWPPVESGDTMPNYLYDNTIALEPAWDQWTNWNTGANWSYRPVCVNDFFNAVPGAPTLTQIAAAIWLALPSNARLNVLFPYLADATLGWPSANARDHIACQMAVNIVDYADNMAGATAFNPATGANTYYGYEERDEKLFITMVAVSQYDTDADLLIDGDATEETYYAIELYNPGPRAVDLQNWDISVNGGLAFPIAVAATTVNPGNSYILADSTAGNGFAAAEVDGTDGSLTFADNDTIELIWHATGQVYDYISDVDILPTTLSAAGTVDKFRAYRNSDWIANGFFMLQGTGANACNLPVMSSVCTWDTSPLGANINTVPFNGNANTITAPIQTSVSDALMLTSGEIYNIFAYGNMTFGGTTYNLSNFMEAIRPTVLPFNITDITAGKLDPSLIDFQDIIKFITVFNPFNDFEPSGGPAIDNNNNGIFNEPTELAVAGRININTAPWYVISQLPCLADTTLDPFTNVNRYKLARAITAYRDRENISPTNPNSNWGVGAPDYSTVPGAPGLTYLGDLINVTQVGNAPATMLYDIQYQGKDTLPNLDNAPDTMPFYSSATTWDNLADELEERDILLQRVSNLATVRSDTFTAYIAVRVGERGPIKRFIAIFDRSNVFAPADKPQLVALQPVPDPR